MTDHELLEKINSDDDEQQLLHNAKAQLDIEINKPFNQRDYDLIDKLTKQIALLDGTDEWIQRRSQTGVKLMQAEMLKRHKSITMKKIYIAAPCILTIIILISNALTISVWGTNVFSAVYQIIKGGVTIDFSKESEIIQEDFTTYSDEMKQICEQYNIPAKIPTYIPNGFVPSENYGTFYDTLTKQVLFFNFKRNQEILNFQISKITSSDNSSLGIPTDHHNISIQAINGTTVHIMKEDSQYSAAFMIDDVQYLIATDRLDYDECQKILDSMLN
ncbi:MAG: DUF4367 domain-containing protein [Oscillospiraceae bacterium]|nr:DUF4367 domain-containing protein [Oscillospiraceae bacterium]